MQTSLNIFPLTGILGARIEGLDLSSKITGEELYSITEALQKYEVLVIPDQQLSPEQQVAFSHRLGPYSPVPFVKPIKEHDEVIKIVKEKTEPDAFNFGGVWHSDFSFLSHPPAFTILHAIEVPDFGGDTVWASTTAAYYYLDYETQEKLKKITALHSASASYSPDQQDLHSKLSGMNIETSEKANETYEHPLICEHPASKKPSLFYNNTYVQGLNSPDFETLKDEKKLMQWLHKWTTDIKFTFRHKWSNGDVVIWDNRATQHIALNDYKGQRREMNRTTVGSQQAPRLYK